MKIQQIKTKKNFFSFFMVISLYAMLGCTSTKIFIPSSNSPQSVGNEKDIAIEESNVLKQAEYAWSTNNMVEAQRLYEIIATYPNLDSIDKTIVLERLVKASIETNHFQIVLETLTQWKRLEPTIDVQPFWQESWGIALLHTTPARAISQAKTIWFEHSAPIALRGTACGILMLLSPKDMKSSLAEDLSELYDKSDHTNCIMLEQRLVTLFEHCSEHEIVALEALLTPEKDFKYPWSVITFELVRREWNTNSLRKIELLEKINYPGVFADKSLLTSLEQRGPSLPLLQSKNAFFSSGCYALVLPMSGPYASIGWKIAKGASAAQEELINLGLEIDIIFINTEASDWLEKLKHLPKECIVIGGPLRSESYEVIREHQFFSKKAFFTFLSSLENGDEGVLAWRFFSSPIDQILTSLRFCQELDISTYAVLYPKDSYGEKMAKIFVESAEKMGISVITASYDPENTSNWSGLLSSLTRSRMLGKIPVPSTPFQAMFLPDSWKNIEILMPYLFFQGEDRLVLIGTNLWEQGLSHLGKNNLRNMDLALFPGSWNSATPTSTGAILIERFALEGQEEPDFWVGLGYDFVRFASALNIQDSNWSVETLNKRIEYAQNMDWSIAPIEWNNGKAKQRLFLFRPTSEGIKLVDIHKFKHRLNSIKKRHAKRVTAAEKEAAGH